MTPAQIDMFAGASAQVLGLKLDDSQLAAVAAQLAILLDHAGKFTDFELSRELEPLTVFEP